ncbi:MAG: hypothetical protein RLZZ04_3398 [Cyanobacteriota bacterium]|jgi:uncharacterized membrane protein YfcA
MSFHNWLILWYSGILIGLLSGLVGIGGGTILLPLLINLGYSPIQSVSTSSLVISLTTLSSCTRNYRMGHFDIRRIVFLATPTVMVAPLGVYLSSKVPSFILLICFGIFLAINILLANIRKNLHQKQNNQLKNENTINVDHVQQNIIQRSKSTASLNKILSLEEITTIYEQRGGVASASLDKKYPLEDNKDNKQGGKYNTSLARLITGALSGFLAGIFGIGGGAIMVPMQMLLLKENIKVAIQTSLGVIFITSISNLLIYAQQGSIEVLTGLTLGFGGLCGAQVGSYYLPKLANKTVNFIFNVILAILSANMFWQAGIKYCAIAPCA